MFPIPLWGEVKNLAPTFFGRVLTASRAPGSNQIRKFISWEMMMNALKFLALAGGLFFLSGCSVMAVRNHEPNFKTVREMEKAKLSVSDVKIAGLNPRMQEVLAKASLGCRMMTFSMPAGKTVGTFIQSAFHDELDAAKKLSPQGKTAEIGVKHIESDTAGISKGSWTLDFDYTINGKTTNVRTVTPFESAYMGDAACRNTANALTDALSDNFANFSKKLQ